MRKLSAFFLLLFPAAILHAQTTPPADDGTVSMANLSRLLRTQLTITPGWSVTGFSGNDSASISGGRTNVYLHGTAEYYFTERFSMRGDLFYFLNKNKVAGGMKHNHSLQVGASWHLLKGSMIDPFIGARAGLSLAQVYPMDLRNSATTDWIAYPVKMHLDPNWAPHVGVNIFGQRIFHFFIEAQYLIGSYRPPVGPVLSLNEVRVSAGLGWNWVFTHKEATVRPGI